MIYHFDGETASEAWSKAATALVRNEVGDVQSSRAGETREILHAVFTIAKPEQRWVLARDPAINPAFAIAEVIWILSGRRDAAFLNYWNSQLPKYAGNCSDYYGAYGYRLRHQFGFDQLERAYSALQHNPDSRQVSLHIWNPVLDFPKEDGAPTEQDIPCNIASLLKIRGGKLEWTQVVRSNDLFRGVPYNFIQFTTIQEVMAGWLGVGVGSYLQHSDSLHAYTPDLESMRADLTLDVPPNTDTLALPKAQSDESISVMARCLDDVRSPELTKCGLQELSTDVILPAGYRNLLLVTAAEAARKRKWTDLAEHLILTCSNNCLETAWHRWVSRLSSS